MILLTHDNIKIKTKLNLNLNLFVKSFEEKIINEINISDVIPKN